MKYDVLSLKILGDERAPSYFLGSPASSPSAHPASGKPLKVFVILPFIPETRNPPIALGYELELTRSRAEDCGTATWLELSDGQLG